MRFDVLGVQSSSYLLDWSNRKNSQKITHLYPQRIFHRIIILSIQECMLTAIALLIATASAVADPGPSPEINTQYLWLNHSQTHSTASYLTLPKARPASYFVHLKNSQEYQKEYQIFIELEQARSGASLSQMITCQIHSGGSSCQYMDRNFFGSPKVMSPEKIIGFLRSSDQDEKQLQLFSGGMIEIITRKAWKQYIQFGLVAASVLIVVVGLNLARITKYLDQRFAIQLMLSLVVFLRESAEYVREGIEDWSQQGWKFWLFIPLSIVAYLVLQSFMEACLNRRISLKILVSAAIFNYLVDYIFSSNLLYVLASYCSLFLCQIDQSYLQSLSPFQKQAATVKSLQIMRIIFTIIHLKLVFVKEFSYLVTYNPIYFAIGSAIVVSIWQFDRIRLKKIEKQKLTADLKDQIKIFNSKADLVAQHPSYSVSDILEEECAICYQKIESDWARTACHHIFHADCLKSWLEKSETCPIDRKRALTAKDDKEWAKRGKEQLLL